MTDTMSQPIQQANALLEGPLLQLSQLVHPSEILHVNLSDYISNTQTWSTSKDKKPRLVLRPASVESLSKIVAFLHDTDLEYKVRTSGFGSASARDVLISMSAFDDFEFNQEEEYVILGAGNTWAAYYDKMAAVAPEWSVVSARTPPLGVGGSILSAGFSWLSSQYGCISDPSNLLDVHVVTADGKVQWAREDPDLLWALRGSESGFAVATHFKLRARKLPYHDKIWAGAILFPRSAGAEVAKGIISMVDKEKAGQIDGRTAMFLFLMQKEHLKFLGGDQDMIMLHAFDARGEEAGRAEFDWAFKITGAIDMTKGNMTMREVAALQAQSGGLSGKGEMYWTAVCLDTETEMTEEVIMKAFDWWTSILSEPGSLAEFGFLILEFFATCDNLTGRSSSAWPRPAGFKYEMLLGTGCGPNSDEKTSDRAKQLMVEAPEKILGKSIAETDVIPIGPEPFHNIERIYGDHMVKLRGIKARVDPRNRLQGAIRPL